MLLRRTRAVLACGALGAAGATGSWAAFSDTASVSGGEA